MEVIETNHILTPLGKLVLFGGIIIIAIIFLIICYAVSSTGEETKVSVEETVVSREVLEETEESKNQVTGIKTITTNETEEETDEDTTVSIDEIEISTSTSRVGNTYTLSQSTGLYENEDLTGNFVTYKAGTKLVVIEEISDTVDYVQSVKTGKYGYVDNTNYK